MLYLVRIFAIIVAWTLVQSNNQREKLFFIDQSSGEVNETLLVVTWMEDDEIASGCEIFRDKDLISQVVRSSSSSPIQKLSGDELQILLQDCTEFVLRRRRRETEDDKYEEDYEENSEINLVDDIINGPSKLAINGQQESRQQTSYGQQRTRYSPQQIRYRQRQNRRPGRREYYNIEQSITTSTSTTGSNEIKSTTNFRESTTIPLLYHYYTTTSHYYTPTRHYSKPISHYYYTPTRHYYNPPSHYYATSTTKATTTVPETATHPTTTTTTSHYYTPTRHYYKPISHYYYTPTRHYSPPSHYYATTTTKATTTVSETTTYSTTTTTTTVPETTTYPTTTTTLGYDGLPVIYPGTKWCGAGAIAKSYGDLGMHKDTDICCRAHDLCNETLAPGETRYNLTNTSPFTKLSCRCDEAFYNCLTRVNSFTSNSIGNMYFNVLRRECYKKEYPLTNKCKTYLTLLKITCVEYERNRTAQKVYQWIPAQRYKNIPGLEFRY